MFDSVKAPLIEGGRPRSITQVILEISCDHLIETADIYLEKIMVFLWDEFGLLSSVSCTFTPKVGQNRLHGSQPRNATLIFLTNTMILSETSSYHLIYIDKPGYNK